jgi:hypothetical protein
MTPFGKISLVASVALPLVLGGCRPNRGTANPEDYLPLIQVALAGGETAALIGRNEALKAKNFAGCVSAEALAAGFDAGSQVLGGRLQDKITFPALEIDVSDCLPLRPTGESAYFKPIVTTVKIAGYVATTEPAATEPAATEPAATEPAATEPAATEPAATEPEEKAVPVEELVDDEDLAREADPMLAGSADAALLIEAIAGVTITAVLHYATKLKTANCKKGTAALGAVHYINGMIKPVADEVAAPDGKVSVPAVTIDLSECAQG